MEQRTDLSAVFHEAGIGICLVDPTGRFIVTNPCLQRMLGYTASELGCMTVADVTYEDDLSSVHDGLRSLFQDDLERYEREKRYVRKDGRLVWGRLTATIARDSQGRASHAVGMVEDITERRRVEEELRASRERLEVLSRRLLAVQESERRHIARELHDDLGQLLTAAKMTLAVAQRATAGTATAERVATAVALVDQAIARMRSLALDLRPAMLDDLGLVPALRWYLRRHADATGLRMALDVPDMLGPLPPAAATACFRIVQEAVTNTTRHAAARSVAVSLRCADGVVEVRIVDDGVGFDTDAARRRAHGGQSVGLLGMAERASLAGGTLTVESTPGRGTTVQAVLPVRD